MCSFVNIILNVAVFAIVAHSVLIAGFKFQAQIERMRQRNARLAAI